MSNILPPKSYENHLLDEDFILFSDLIYRQAGIKFTQSNRITLEGRILERMRNLELATIEEYYNLINFDEHENKLFLSSVTTNLTRFFRTPAHFEALEKMILPILLSEKKSELGAKKYINIWSAGCSTGEEAYSLAIHLLEHLPPDTPFQILATDISLNCLYTAHEGLYSEEKCQDIPGDLLSKYFIQQANGYLIKQHVKKYVIFDYGNLILNPHYKRFDIIFCRNVLIYFDQNSQRKVIDNICHSMASHSYLILGHTESLESIYQPFPPRMKKTEYITVYERAIHNEKD
ncbi:MAG: CheR family methyltransferase [Spirochaetia bacterium]